MFFMVEIKSDIAFPIAIAACFAKNPSHAHTTEAVKIIFCYLKGSINCDITYGIDGDNLFIIGYLDSHWSRDKESLRLISDFIFMLNRDPIS